jgi:ABC-type lipoprotein release transport system permease subunit
VWIVAVVLILAGRLIGVAMGVMGTTSMYLAAEDLARDLSAPMFLVAVGYATGAAPPFGIYPPVQALRFQPVDALRYE